LNIIDKHNLKYFKVSSFTYFNLIVIVQTQYKWKTKETNHGHQNQIHNQDKSYTLRCTIQPLNIFLSRVFNSQYSKTIIW